MEWGPEERPRRGAAGVRVNGRGARPALRLTLGELQLYAPVALIGYFRLPGVEGHVLSGRTTLLDLLPTLLDLLGVRAPAVRPMGRTIARHLLDGTPLPHPPGPDLLECFRFHTAQRALVNDRYKLVHDLRAGTLELYDLLQDPHERRNVIDDEPAQTARMWSTLAATVDRLRATE